MRLGVDVPQFNCNLTLSVTFLPTKHAMSTLKTLTTLKSHTGLLSYHCLNYVNITSWWRLGEYQLQVLPAKLNVKKRYRFKKATLYEREVIKKQKLFIRRQKLPYSDNHSLKDTYYVNQLLSSYYTCIKISMMLEAWKTLMYHSFNFMSKLS